MMLWLCPLLVEQKVCLFFKFSADLNNAAELSLVPRAFPSKNGWGGNEGKALGTRLIRLYLIFLSFFLSFFLFSVILHFHWNQTFFVSHIMWLMVIFILRGIFEIHSYFFALLRDNCLNLQSLLETSLWKWRGELVFNFRLNEELKGFLAKNVLVKPSFALFLIYIYTGIEGQILERSWIIL